MNTRTCRPFLQQLYQQRILRAPVDAAREALPNFLIGLVLLDDDPQLARLRRIIEKQLTSRIGVTPVGLGRTDSLSDLERKLANWCADELGFRPELAGSAAVSTPYVEIWNGWVGSEREIYRASVGLVDALEPEQFL